MEGGKGRETAPVLVCLCALGIWTEKGAKASRGSRCNACFLSKENTLHTVKRLENVAFSTIAPKMLPYKLSASERERENTYVSDRILISVPLHLRALSLELIQKMLEKIPGRKSLRLAIKI